ncbi:MAG: hypothetical protein Kow0077_17970 [Anaerolineae bacterium]
MAALKPADLELLSAYLDGELTVAERAALERRLAEDAALRAELEALRAVVMGTRALPVMKAPRDFRLDPAVYGRPAPARVSFRRAYRWAGSLSAVAALVTFVIGVLGLVGPQFMPSAPAALQQEAPAVAAAPTLTAIPTQAGARALVTAPALEAALPTAAGNLAATLTLPAPVEEAAPMIAAESDETPDLLGAEAAGMAEAESAEAQAPEGAAVQGFAAEAGEETLTLPDDLADSARMPDAVPPSGALQPPVGTGGGGEAPPTPPAEVGEAVAAEAAVDAAAQDAVVQSTETDASKAAQGTSSPPPTLMATASPEPALAERAEREEPPTAEPAAGLLAAERAALRPDPGLFIGASLVLLALAVVLFALSRRS